MPTSRPFTLPISGRSPQTWRQTVHAVLFCILFNFGCLMIHGTQLTVLLPLNLLPFPWSKRLYYEGIRYTKGSFGYLMILMSQWFAPTKLVITFENDGKGKFTPEEIEQVVVRNKSGEIVSLDLPTKFVLIANHQIYADWWYGWCFTYFMSPRGVHRHVYITLKKSLRWVPIVGWGMQFYKFIFLARSWASDRLQLATDLASLGKTAESEDKPFCFILYPEGTLVSENTRPISKKFADKMGIEDLKHILLPRSTGLHYTLRSLAPRIQDLKLLDVTVVYPGIPPMGYGQSYYTLRSIFLDGIPPPLIHMHLRLFDVQSEVPIGRISIPSKGKVNTRTQEVDIPETEKDTFNLWLRELWQDKDTSITKFHETGRLDNVDSKNPVIHIPLKLQRIWEILDAFCFFIPAAVVYFWRRLIQ